MFSSEDIRSHFEDETGGGKVDFIELHFAWVTKKILANRANVKRWKQNLTPEQRKEYNRKARARESYKRRKPISTKEWRANNRERVRAIQRKSCLKHKEARTIRQRERR